MSWSAIWMSTWMEKAEEEPLVINGWTIRQHPAFESQVVALTKEVVALKAKDSDYRESEAAKHLAAIRKLMFETIPADPASPSFEMGKTLSKEYTGWYRAKFYQQYRLFFRYSTADETIIYGWVNDKTSKRAYGKKTDAYKEFQKRLGKGKPPTTWEELKRESNPIPKDKS